MREHSNAPTLQRSHAPTLQRSHAPTLQRFNAPTLQRSNAHTKFDTSLTLSIPRKSQSLNRLHYPSLENFDTLTVYRGRCVNEILEKADVQLFKVQSSRFEVQCFRSRWALAVTDRLPPRQAW